LQSLQPQLITADEPIDELHLKSQTNDILQLPHTAMLCYAVGHATNPASLEEEGAGLFVIVDSGNALFRRPLH
jgi:hypothetical protein